MGFSISLVQETFESGLSAFQTEGIGSMTAMMTELVSQPHPQSKAIQQRHGDVMRRWEKLRKDSEAYKARLLRALEQCHKVCAYSIPGHVTIIWQHLLSCDCHMIPIHHVTIV